MARAIQLTDPRYTPIEAPGPINQRFLAVIKDPRDLPFVHLIVTASLVMIPLAVTLFVWERFSGWWTPVYVGACLLFFSRYILMLHNTSHRRLFKRGYGALNHYIPWVLGLFFGETPETYFAHHIGMHHPENNLPDDLSSTMRYRRDSFVDFMKYFLRFFFAGLFELVLYHRARKRFKLMRRAMAGELGFYALVIGLSFVSWQATVTVFLIPFALARFLMMAGNWGQHGFIDANDPGNSYLNSITCINCGYNQMCYNDGYHIGHHVKPNRHWTDLPADFDDSREEYARQGSIVFEKIDFFIVWGFLMLKRYDWLAKYFVELRDTPRTKEEVIALLKERTRPITPQDTAAV